MSFKVGGICKHKSKLFLYMCFERTLSYTKNNNTIKLTCCIKINNFILIKIIYTAVSNYRWMKCSNIDLSKFM
jgi:hypothetical protein